jgi:AcrR family transcriptional regulator
MPGTAKKATARVPVTRERALRAAMAVADAEGLAALTMRRLAQEVGVEAMSLYHHVANKDDILDGMVDLVFTEIELPADGDEWKPAMRARAVSARAALMRHPWAIDIMNSRIASGPATLRHHDAVIGCCLQAGMSAAMAGHSFSLIDSYLYGFVMQESALPFDETSDIPQILDEMYEPFPANEYPHLMRFTTEYIMKPGYKYGDEFEWGLDLVLDGLEALPRT